MHIVNLDIVVKNKLEGEKMRSRSDSQSDVNLVAKLACCCLFVPIYVTVVVAFNVGGTALNGKDGESWLDDICNKYDIDDDAKCDLWNLLHLVFPEACAVGAALSLALLACCGGVATCCLQGCRDTFFAPRGEPTDGPDLEKGIIDTLARN
ncbi:MAG: hypothetical protein CL816_04145 [Coxiellaceae bacterium]|nr:hypothetical protein [Coxiellaceae bacterium]|tara:strand:- start:4287 stop:4739 length:453 start_codon:yes stop_codon:yes gene_type:complete